MTQTYSIDGIKFTCLIKSFLYPWAHVDQMLNEPSNKFCLCKCTYFQVDKNTYRIRDHFVLMSGNIKYDIK